MNLLFIVTAVFAIIPVFGGEQINLNTQIPQDFIDAGMDTRTVNYLISKSSPESITIVKGFSIGRSAFTKATCPLDPSFKEFKIVRETQSKVSGVEFSITIFNYDTQSHQKLEGHCYLKGDTDFVSYTYIIALELGESPEIAINKMNHFFENNVKFH